MTESIDCTISLAKVVSFAMHQANVPVVRELRLRNATADSVDGITVEMQCDPPVIAPRRWTFDRIRGSSEVAPADLTVTLDGGMLYTLVERMRATVNVRVMQGDRLISHRTDEIIALSRHEWGGALATPELLAAFVTPNDPAIAVILREASDKLREAGRDPSLNGYQSQSRERVWEMAAAIWAALAARRLIYAEPPASFETAGQKVRLPSEVLSTRLATCLDTTVLFAAALEQIGLRPLICLTRGHALAAVWLQPATLLGVATDDASDLRNYVELKELAVFETTAITSEPPATFSQALSLGTSRIRPEADDDFVLALDIKQARARQVTPLPTEVERLEDGERTKLYSPPLDTPPALPPFTPATTDVVPDTPQGRLDAWKRRLLDLTKRNRLLNLKASKTALRLVCADPGRLEDLLAEGAKITIVPMETLAGRGSGRDEAHLLAQQKVDFEKELSRQALENGQVPARLGDADLKTGIVELFRKAKSDLEEGGANTLFLALGMLRWRESDAATTWHLAPLLLIPVRLERATAASPPRLVQHPDDSVFNHTLLEMLRQDFELRIPQLEGELPTDSHGVDVNGVLTIVRQAIRDVKGWEVLNDMVLSTFSFAKYLMWKDLHDNTEALRETAFVKHMIDTPRDRYDRSPTFLPVHEHDDRIDPASLLTPLSCDSSQVAAIHASGGEGDFVLEGPPGTGKSQTISNLIAHNLGLGRKVLFVAEKLTALHVVHDRLRKVGLGDFCLELHSSKANKKDVLAQLDRAWTRRGDGTTEQWAAEAARLKTVRARLNALVRALHMPGATGISPRDAIARASASVFAPSVTLDWAPKITSDRARDAAGRGHLRVLARDLGLAYAQTTLEDAQAFGALRQSEWSYQWQGQITAAAAAFLTALDAADVATQQFLDVTKLPGSRTTLAHIRRVAVFAESVPLAARMNLQAVLSPDGVELSERLGKAVAALGQFRQKAARLSTPCDPSCITAPSVDAIRRAWQSADGKFWPLSFFARRRVMVDAMQRFGAAQRLDLATDLPTLAFLANVREEMRRTTAGLPPSALWRDLDTDAAQVEELIRLGEVAREATARLARDPSELMELRERTRTLFIDGRDLLQPGMPVAAAAASLNAARDGLETAFAAFAQLAAIATPEDVALSQLRELALKVIERATRLNAWCRWQEMRTQADAEGLRGLVVSLETHLIRPEQAAAAFDVAYARWLAPLLIDSRDELRRFSALAHSQLVDEFRRVDEHLSKLAAETIRARVSQVIPRKSEQDTLSGFSVLRREVQRRSRHLPVRTLVSEMGDALTRLTPCVLMSPHSVAQFLAPGMAKFDLVVFDEASQIAVWDAIGAIARGRNAIIVGDPKQMPPTNFFGRAADDDDSIDADVSSTNVNDLESILDEGLATGMHHHRLTGHYRSQHESLIAFSNLTYYEGQLVTYPAAVTKETVVSLRRCQGAYQKGKGRTNPEEAKSVVAEIVRRLTDPARRHETIGVVTMNSEQQRLIRNLLDDERRKRPDIEAAFRDSSGEEIEMVYNLETVQGHEREVIMLSIGYGPTVSGDRTMSMNFGPLNRAGGERRLNVAVTRAIREVVVFASFDPDMIDLSRTSAQAVHDLKAYLDFASRGPVALAQRSSFAGGVDEFESVFEELVAARLRAKGWTIQTQVGVSKFRIDLGVVHPDYPARFLAGVECDGASFHSSPTARDRDRVRHAVLSSLGWKLLRLWSTDYFLDPDAAIARVHEALTTLYQEERAATADAGPSESDGVNAVAATEFDEDDVDLTSEVPDDEETSDDSAPTAAWESSAGTPAPDDETSDLAHGLLRASTATPKESTPLVPRTSLPGTSTDDAPLRAFASEFYQDAYRLRLRPVCLELIDSFGPITFVDLAERIARQHGFLRTGSEIKKRVWAAVGRQRRTSKAPDGAVTFWPAHMDPSAFVPYRGSVVAGVERPWHSVPYVERLGLAMDVVRSVPDAARVAEFARRIGVGRLRAKTRDELIELLESAVAIESSGR